MKISAVEPVRISSNDTASEVRSRRKEIANKDSNEMQPAQVQTGLGSTEKEVIKAIEHANHSYVGRYTQLEFSIHEKTKQIMVKVLDKDTGVLIREIPPEKVLDFVAHMWEKAGIIVDDRV